MTLKIAVLALLAGAIRLAGAEEAPLYQQQLEQAVTDAEALRHSAERLRDHKEVTMREKLLIQPFHKPQGELETAPAAFCRNCHGPLPHGKQPRNRAFLNMHVRFIACESCHFRPKGVELGYRWFDYQSRQPVKGEGLFRLGHEIDNAKQRPNNPKIAPFYRGRPAMLQKDSALSRDLAARWEKAPLEDKIGLRAKIHQPLEKQGPACHDCHNSEQSLLDLPALGATPAETQAMQKHVIPQFFKRYQKDDQRITILNLLR
jgi:hypothetical protein